jgi:hypothetical protein
MALPQRGHDLGDRPLVGDVARVDHAGRKRHLGEPPEHRPTLTAFDHRGTNRFGSDVEAYRDRHVPLRESLSGAIARLLTLVTGL